MTNTNTATILTTAGIMCRYANEVRVHNAEHAEHVENTAHELAAIIVDRTTTEQVQNLVNEAVRILSDATGELEGAEDRKAAGRMLQALPGVVA